MEQRTTEKLLLSAQQPTAFTFGAVAYLGPLNSTVFSVFESCRSKRLTTHDEWRFRSESSPISRLPQSRNCSEEYIGRPYVHLVSVARITAMRLALDKARSRPLPSMSTTSRRSTKWIGCVVEFVRHRSDRASKKKERKIRQAFHIYKRKPQINRDQAVERSAVWNVVL